MATGVIDRLTSAALEELQARYRDRWRGVVEAKAEGRPVVGFLGDVPRALAEAAGLFAVQVTAPVLAATPDADLYMDDILSPETHALFQAVHDGAFSGLDLLVLTRAYDKLFYYLKEGLRIGLGAAFPPLHMFDLMQSRRPAVETYNRRQLDQLIDQLQRIGGRSISDAALADALQRQAAVQDLQRRLMVQRRRGVVSGVEALEAIGAGRSLDARDYAHLLAAFVDDLEREPTPAGAQARLLVASAEPLDSPRLHALLESAGAQVVAEDDVWGSRAADEFVTDALSPKEALFQAAWRGAVGAGVYPPEARHAWFDREALADDVDAVIFYVPPSDRMFGWDYPQLKDRLDRAGKLSLLIRGDVERDKTAVTAQARTFVASLPKRAAS